jgi:hypothetical protein
VPYSPIIQVHWQQNGIVTEAPVSEFSRIIEVAAVEDDWIL